MYQGEQFDFTPADHLQRINTTSTRSSYVNNKSLFSSQGQRGNQRGMNLVASYDGNNSVYMHKLLERSQNS